MIKIDNMYHNNHNNNDNNEDHPHPSNELNSNHKKTKEEEQELINKLLLEFPHECNENKELVEFMSLVMLRYRNYEYDQVKRRLNNYLKWRKELFGNLEYFNINNEKDAIINKVLLTNVLQVYKGINESDPALIFGQMQYHNPSIISALDIIKTWHYLILSNIKYNMNLCENGFIVINNLTNAGFNNIDHHIPPLIGNAVSNCMPIRLKYAIFFNPPFIVHYFLSIIKLFFSSKLQDRMRMLYDNNLLQTELHINPNLIPNNLGGNREILTSQESITFYKTLNYNI